MPPRITLTVSSNFSAKINFDWNPYKFKKLLIKIDLFFETLVPRMGKKT